MKTFELVVPAYNEEKNLEMLVDRAIKAAESFGYKSQDFNLVLVNNGSFDNSKAKLNELLSTSRAQWFRVVNVEKNQGYGFGLWSGLQTVQSQYVGWSHADMQCDPADAFKALGILRTLAEHEQAKTLVKGVRSGRDWKDRFVSFVFMIFSRVLLGLTVGEINAQPKVFQKGLLGKIKNPPKTFAFDLYVLYQAQKANYDFKTVEVLFPPRIHGVSNWASSFLGRYKTIAGMIRYMRTLANQEGRIN